MWLALKRGVLGKEEERERGEREMIERERARAPERKRESAQGGMREREREKKAGGRKVGFIHTKQ